jgi:hypothetical protein
VIEPERSLGETWRDLTARRSAPSGLGRMPDRYWSSDMDAELFDPRTAFAELGRIMLGAQDLNQTLQRIADLARKTIPEIDEVSLTLVDGGQPKTVVFTGQLAVLSTNASTRPQTGRAWMRPSAGKPSSSTPATTTLDIRSSPRQPGAKASPMACRSGCLSRSGSLAPSTCTRPLLRPSARTPWRRRRPSPATPE